MQSPTWFIRLKPNDAQALLKPAAEVLRESYLDILTLLQDLLGRYSSAGNETVFLQVQDVTHLLYESLKRIKTFIPEVKWATDCSVRVDRVDWSHSSKEKELLVIGSRTKYHLSKSSDELIGEMGNLLLLWLQDNIQHKADRKADIESLATIVHETSLANIRNAEQLKYLCSEPTKELSDDAIKGVDSFLDDLRREYDLLRNPNVLDSNTPPTNKKKTRSQAAKQSRLGKTD
jgi:hypothetical protein